jgi:hypothetical protein
MKVRCASESSSAVSICTLVLVSKYFCTIKICTSTSVQVYKCDGRLRASGVSICTSVLICK